MFNNINFKRVAVTLKRCEVDTCQVCGCNIFEHEEYYDIYGILICMSCTKDYKKGGS